MRSLSALALSLVLLGCAMIPSNASGPPLPLEFHAQPRPLGSGDDEQAAARAGSGTISVNGVLTAATPCHDLSGEATRSGQSVVLRVTVARRDAPCTQVIATFGYVAVISGLEPGRYDLHVEYIYPGSGWGTRTALDQSLTVQ